MENFISMSVYVCDKVDINYYCLSGKSAISNCKNTKITMIKSLTII